LILSDAYLTVERFLHIFKVVSFKPDDIKLVNDGAMGTRLQGKLKLGKNDYGTVYTGPKAMLSRGTQSYHWQLVALKEAVNRENLSTIPTKEELSKEIIGKVLEWGEWTGVFRRGHEHCAKQA